MSEIDNIEAVQLDLFVNGSRVTGVGPRLGECHMDVHETVEGRAVVLARVQPVEMYVRLVVDAAPLAAVHARTSYGFSHLAALLEALPRCQHIIESGGPSCPRVAHWRSATAAGIAYRCGQHTARPDNSLHVEDWTELPYAPAVRHIEEYVQQWREKRLPMPENSP